MKNTISVLNELLVSTFNDILSIEQKALHAGVFKDLSVTEVHTIEAIGMYGTKTMSEVAGIIGITVGTLTTAINHLVRKEYVTREKSEADRRVVHISLTSKGKLAYRVHEKFHADMVRGADSRGRRGAYKGPRQAQLFLQKEDPVLKYN
jgi:DNA-binding MarR family transcriptional regulator